MRDFDREFAERARRFDAEFAQDRRRIRRWNLVFGCIALVGSILVLLTPALLVFAPARGVGLL